MRSVVDLSTALCASPVDRSAGAVGRHPRADALRALSVLLALCCVAPVGCQATGEAEQIRPVESGRPPSHGATAPDASEQVGHVIAPSESSGAGGLPDMSVRHANHYPTRVAVTADERVYVSDVAVGSVFIYAAGDLATPTAELSGLARPLGIAVDGLGRIYVGNDGRRNVEIYDRDGSLVGEIDSGNLDQPNDLALDRDGNVYVAASRSNSIKVYSSAGQWLRDIAGPADDRLSFPSALCIGAAADGDGEELYVADQQHALIRVFALDGTLRRSFGGKQTAVDTEGRFVRLQSLALDEQGRLHALDVTTGEIEVLDRSSGAFITSFGSLGTAPGELNLPLDITVVHGGLLVTNAANQRVELLAIPQST